MLTTLLLLGLLDGDGSFEVGEGPIIAIDERIAVLPKVQTTAAVAAPIPLGAIEWKVPFDPSDRAPYAYDWSEPLGETDLIGELVQITMSASGASLGLRIDVSGGRNPIISTDKKSTQIWFVCDDDFQQNAAFAGSGVKVGVSMRIRTDSTPYKQFERTAVLTVRQQ